MPTSCLPFRRPLLKTLQVIDGSESYAEVFELIDFPVSQLVKSCSKV